MVRHSIGNLFGPLAGISQVVFALILVHPRPFGKSWHMDLVDVAVNLSHVILQLGIVALSVAPYNIRCAIVVSKDGGVDAGPAVL